jgi:hypothetical protein
MYGQSGKAKRRQLPMTIKTLMSIEEYDALPEKEGVKYELNEGRAIAVSPSPRLVHNRMRAAHQNLDDLSVFPGFSVSLAEILSFGTASS